MYLLTCNELLDESDALLNNLSNLKKMPYLSYKYNQIVVQSCFYFAQVCGNTVQMKERNYGGWCPGCGGMAQSRLHEVTYFQN